MDTTFTLEIAFDFEIKIVKIIKILFSLFFLRSWWSDMNVGYKGISKMLTHYYVKFEF